MDKVHIFNAFTKNEESTQYNEYNYNNDNLMEKLNYMVHLLEDQKEEKE